MKPCAAIAALLSLSLPAPAAEEARTYRTDHAVVTYAGIGEPYAKAIAQTCQAARNAAVEQFGFDMPESIAVSVTADRKKRTRLFNDGHDSFSLTVRTERDLRRPRYSRIFHIYGMCHEVGHLAMYRPIRDHGWMTTAAAEGWAHWLGSRLVDAVFAKHGEALWPDRYDYRADGMARLKRQIASGSRSATVRGAAQWARLVAIVGDKQMPGLFKAWGAAKIDPHDPAAALRKVLLATCRGDGLADWWNGAEAMFVFKRPRSGFAARTIKPGDLMGDEVELAHDDGKRAGHRSSAGGGHAVRFQAAGGDWYLTAVQVHGARYGYPRAPREDFHVWLCDAEMKEIADFPFPYGAFARGAAKWVTLKVKPTQVPTKFAVCVAFNPTRTKGVFVSHDAAGEGHSLSALPGKGGQTFRDGDWLIRVRLDQPKTADALKAPR